MPTKARAAAAAKRATTRSAASRQTGAEPLSQEERENPQPKGPRIRVMALQDLYDRDNRYVRANDVLTIPESDFDPTVHQRVDNRTRERITSSNAALERERQETLAQRAAASTLGGRTQAGQQTDIDNPTGQGDPLGAGDGGE